MSFRPFVSSYVTSPEAPNGLPLTVLRTVALFSRNEGVAIRSDRSVFLIGCVCIFGTYAGIGLVTLLRDGNEKYANFTGENIKGAKHFEELGVDGR